MELELIEQIREALSKAIAIERPKLKEGQTLKTEINIIDKGIKVHVYPVSIEEDE